MSIQDFLESENQFLKPSPLAPGKTTPFGRKLVSPKQSQEPRSFVSFNCSPSNNSCGQFQETLLSQPDYITEISDYNDKLQIHNAIASAQNKEEKIKLIDYIIKTREEKAQLAKNKNKKLFQASARLIRVAHAFSNHGQPMSKINKFKQSLQELIPHDQPLQDLNLTSSIFTNASVTPEPDFLRKYKLASGTRIAVQEDDSDESGVSQPEGNNLVFPFEEDPILLQTGTSRANVIGSFSSLGSTSGFKFVGNSGRNTLSFAAKTPSGGKKFGYSDIIEEGSTFSTRAGMYTTTSTNFSVQNELRSKLISPKRLSTKDQDPITFAIGAKKLEKDIYQYLVKDEINQEEKQVILSLPYKKRERMRDVESRAIMHYKQAKREESKLLDGENDFKKSVLLTNPEKPRAMSNNNFYDPTLKKRIAADKGMMRIDEGRKSSTFIRKVDSGNAFTGGPLKKLMRKHRVQVNLNDSLYSDTETRLDALYKQASRTNKSLKKVEQKISQNESKEELKSLQRVRDIKMKDLSEQSSKIRLLIKKKVIGAFG